MSVPNISLGGIPKRKEPASKSEARGDGGVGNVANEAAAAVPNPSDDTSGEVNMSVSPICMKNGQKVAYVRFTEGERFAEGEIPACRITGSGGYSPEEIKALEDYMKAELPRLKKMAAQINILDIFLKS